MKNTMGEYTCHFLLTDGTIARAVYHAEWVYDAMAMHNAAKPEFSEAVIKWTNGSLSYHAHDPKATI